MQRRGRRSEHLHGRLLRLAIGALLLAGTAVADGGNPRAYEILFEPGRPAHMLIHSHYWGLFDQHEGAPNWSLLCTQAFGGRATDPDNFSTVMAVGGRVLVAANFGGLVVSDDPCTWKKLDVFDSQLPEGLAPVDATGKNFVLVTVKNENGPSVSRAYSTSDRGDTWTLLAGTLPQNFSAAAVAVAPSDAKRIYIVGAMVNSGPRLLAVSTDGGASFAMLPIAAMDQYDATAGAPLSVAGIDPKNPDVVFVRADGADDTAPPLADELWVTSDAGKTWRKSYVPMQDLPGFTYSPDGTQVLVGGPLDGIQAAPVADAIAGNAAAFHQVYHGMVWGLAVHDGKLYAGNDDFGMKPPFTVGVSTDQGTTFTPVMNHCEVAFPTCAADSTMETLCRVQWERQGGYVTDFLQVGACIAGGATGAGGVQSMNTGGTGGGVGGSPQTNLGGTAGVVVTSAGGAPASSDQTMHTAARSTSCSIGASRPTSATTALAALAGFAVGFVRRSSRKRRRLRPSRSPSVPS